MRFNLLLLVLVLMMCGYASGSLIETRWDFITVLCAIGLVICFYFAIKYLISDLTDIKNEYGG